MGKVVSANEITFGVQGGSDSIGEGKLYQLCFRREEVLNLVNCIFMEIMEVKWIVNGVSCWLPLKVDIDGFFLLYIHSLWSYVY